jgi:integrase
MLTDIAVRNARPKTKPYKLTDAESLYLEVHPNGSRYWRYRYRWQGKERRLALGVYPEISLAQAREERDRARALLKRGIDPVAHRREAVAQREAEALNSFEVLALEWYSHQQGRWTVTHAGRILDSFKADVFPFLGERPLARILPQEVLACIRRVEARGAIETAGRILQRINAVFRFAIITGRATYNPAQDLKGALKAPVRKHYAALTARDLPEFLSRCEAYEGDYQTRLALRLLCLTFVRTGELRYAEWSEFDLKAGLWCIPGERMKVRTPHIVPLSQQAIEILIELHRFTGRYRLLFPSRSNVNKPISENTILYALYRMGYHGRATGHGFRALAASTLAEMGFRPDVIERQLAHAERNKTKAAYIRSEYLEERRKMMQQWADYLTSVRDNVVPLRRIG